MPGSQESPRHPSDSKHTMASSDAEGLCTSLTQHPDTSLVSLAHTSDEDLPFYFVMRLPTTPALNRTQAVSLLVPPPAVRAHAPHVSLTADVSYVDADAQQRPQTSSAAPPPPPQRSSSLSGLGIRARPTSAPPASTAHPARTAGTASSSSGSNGPHVSMTPSPQPATRPEDSDFATDAPGVPLWTAVFTSAADSAQSRKGKQKELGTLGRVWVGLDVSRSSDDEQWIGVWEFHGIIR